MSGAEEQKQEENRQDQLDTTVFIDEAVSANDGGSSNRERSESSSLFNEKFRIIKPLGEGGMSIVYLAEDITLKRKVALKQLHVDPNNVARNLARFTQEARAASALRHPRIVSVHECGISHTGVPFLVMDYVEGISLAEEIKDIGALPLERVVKIAIQICEALVEAHNHGVVHRDIKPSNIMLVKSADGIDQVQIVDFGIAKLEHTAEDDAYTLTQTGEVFGSPIYMSPEQCQGQRADKRSDLYSLGCVMYEGLTGKPPFRGENVLVTMQEHITGEAKPLGSLKGASAKQVALIQRVINRLLQKKPEDRYVGAAELKCDLEKIIRGERVRIQAPRNSSSRRILVAAGLVLILVATAFTLKTGFLEDILNVELSQEQMHQRWASADLEGQRAFDKGKMQMAKTAFSNALNFADRIQNGDTDQIRAIANAEMCNVYFVQTNRAEREKFLAPYKLYSAKIQKSALSRVVPLYEKLHYFEKKTGELSRAEKAELNQLFEDAIAASTRFSETGLTSLEQMTEILIDGVSKKFGNEETEARNAINLGSLRMILGDRQTSEGLLLRGLALRKKNLPPFDPDLGRAYSLLARAQLEWGKVPSSVGNFETAYKIYRSAYGPSMPQTGSVAARLAKCYALLKNDEKKQFYAKIAVNALANLPELTQNYNGLRCELCSVYLLLNENDRAYAVAVAGLDAAEKEQSLKRFSRIKPWLNLLSEYSKVTGRNEDVRALRARLFAMNVLWIDCEQYLARELLTEVLAVPELKDSTPEIVVPAR